MADLFDWLVKTLYGWVSYFFDIIWGEENGFVWHVAERGLGIMEDMLVGVPDFPEIVSRFDGGTPSVAGDGTVLAQVAADPQASMSSFAFFGSLIARLNVFFPVVEGSWLLLTFVIFVVLFIIYKIMVEDMHLIAEATGS